MSIAEGLAKLHFQALRIGTTERKVKAFGEAIERAGGRAEEATANLQKFAEKFRVDPGFRATLESMGALTKEQR